MDNEHYDNLILIGQEQEIKNFIDFLPKRIEALIIDLNNLQMRENINEIFSAIINDLRQTEKEKDLEIVNDLIGKAVIGKNEILGIEETIEFAKEGEFEAYTY